MKVFISQPMSDKTDDEILNKRFELTEKTIKKFKTNNKEVSFIHSFLEFIPRKNANLYFLAKSLELLSDADVAVFAKDWEKYRGCIIERLCCEEYGIKVIDETEL